nr:LOW QUALITY PROTEIN: disintegrin and metalloproteinase domain-containing protein 18 [Jaculus jaculus]
MGSNETEASERKVMYVITIDGKQYTLHLRKQLFLSQNFLVYTYNETGSFHSDASYFMMNCHYQGHIAEFPDSVVTLSICSGLRGFLQLENITYGIEPLESSVKFEHLVYQIKTVNPDASKAAVQYHSIWKKGQLYKAHLNAQEKKHSHLLPKYVKMHIVVEKALYDYMGSDIMVVTKKIFQIIGLVNTMFTQFKLTIILSSLELWPDKNPISTSGDADNILQRFLAWKRNYLTPWPHDIAHLLIYRKHPKYVGATFPDAICNKSYDASVAVYPEDISLEGFSVIIAQLLGFNIGLIYDNINNCSCSRDTCIMQQKTVSSSGIKTFSNCSMNDYRNYASKFETKCLHYHSDMQIFYKNPPVCGNGILEPNEECDCGNEKECQFKKCCDYKTCRLKGSVKCGSGPCCTSNCELSVAGTPCRKSVDPECDFTEYCNGTSTHCVPDTFALNGHSCSLGSAFCYNGQCQTTNSQCANVFGKGAQGAPYACFKGVNSPHEIFGNCGLKTSQPLPCGQKDVVCGKLVCVQPYNNTYKINAQSILYSHVHDNVCLSIPPGSSVRPDGRDNAYVADGTVCGPKMFCVNKACKAVSLGNKCNATEKCKGNGICNNFGNCQCFPDYRPPDCELQTGSPGGSIDDGNVLKSDTFFVKMGLSNHRDNWIILSFFIFLPFFLTFIIGVKRRNEIGKSCNRDSEGYEW